VDGRAIRVRKNRDGLDAHVAARAEDAQRDLAAVGDEELHGGVALLSSRAAGGGEGSLDVSFSLTTRGSVWDRLYYVYVLASRSRVLYVGVTNDLERRLFEHKSKLVPGFTSKYDVDRLVFFESTPDVYSAIQREKQIKGWRRSKKVTLIQSANPD
jgi:putative endonuclease